MTSDEPSGTRPAQFGLTRRAACSLGLGLSAGALLGSAPARAMAAAPAAPATVRYVITDSRHPESLAFGEFMCSHGAQRLEATTGLTRLWREALLPLWQSGGGAIAGITSQGICAAIAEQGRSWGRRPALIGHHAIAANGSDAAHLVRAPRAVLKGAPALERCGTAWPQMMACLAMQRPAAVDSHTRGPAYRSPALAETPATRSLVSWIIE